MGAFSALLLVGCEPPEVDGGHPAVASCDYPASPPTGDRRLLDGDHVLVVPSADGLHLVRADGTLGFSAAWTALGICDRPCSGEGASADGDGLLVAVNRGDDGSVARLDGFALDGAATLDWRLDGFAFPHDAIRDPADGAVIVPESLESRVTWVGCDAASAEPVRRMTEGRPPEFGDRQPNGADRFDWDGRSYLLLSNRGSALWSGSATLWDITVAGAPTLVWRFPEAGGLATPHSPVLRAWDGRWWLLWAHTDGARPEGSSVGVAVTDDPLVRPIYVADLLPPEGIAPWGYARGIELTDDGTLWITDSSADGWLGPDLLDGTVFEAQLPSLTPTAATGGEQGQVFVRLAWIERLIGGLSMPFEAWLWRTTSPLETTR
jgi:hypothetical protein